MNYFPLFSLTIKHPYYPNGRCLDFKILPTTKTKRLLKNHRSILKTYPDGVQIFTAVNQENIPLISFPDTAVFIFHLYLQNQRFPLFTNFSEITKLSAPLYTNQNSNGDASQLTLTAQKKVKTERFISTAPSPNEIFILGGNPFKVQKKNAFKINGTGIPQIPVDYNEAANYITVNTKSAAVDTPFTVEYLLKPQRPRNTFATVEIKIPVQEKLNSEGFHFQVNFTSKQMRWRYYVVAGKSDDHFVIKSQPDSQVVFGENSHTDLTQNPDASDEIALSLAAKYPQKQLHRFLSDTLITCHQKPIKALQLCLIQTNNGQQTCEEIVSNLPNPSLSNFAVSKTGQNETSQEEGFLFQVIKYFNQDSSTGGN